MSISEVIVKGTYKKADGSPETGTVKFRPALWQQSGGGIDAVLDSSGSFQTKFPSSDSGNWPDGLQIPYRVTVAVSSGTYVKELTFKSADSPIDLPTLFPILSDSGGSGGGGGGGDYLPLSGGTLSGNLEIERAAGDATLSLDGQGGTLRAAQIRTGGTLRWSVGAAPTAETGGNAGSDLAIGRYDDSGNWVDNPLDISRRDGGVNVKSLWIKDNGWIGNVPNPSGPKDVANKNYVDSQIEAKIAAALADRPLIRETKPNGTDRFVEIYDKTTGKWSMVFYDSGDRDLRGLAWPAFSQTQHIKLRRVNNTVYLRLAVVHKDAISLTVSGVLPLGFALEIRTCAIITNETRNDEMRVTASGLAAGDVWVNKAAGSGAWIGGILSGPTKDSIPKSLPGLPI